MAHSQVASFPLSMAMSSFPGAMSGIPSAFVTTKSVDVSQSASTTGWLGGIVLHVVQAIPGFLYWMISFISITSPTWLFALFTSGFTVTLNFTTLLLMALVFASAVSWIVRYRYLNMYTRLPPEPQRKEPQIDLFPDAHQEGDSKRGLSNYLDEFLSAIKVFGYLERPVFHELTRTMQTRKLIAGETLLLEEEQGFCLVVDGLVQIFVKSKREDRDSNSESEEAGDTSNDEDEDRHGRTRQGYHLLTEVKNGAPMSSLFSILSLFTEDVKLRCDDDEEAADSRPTSREPGRSRFSSTAGAMTPISGGECSVHTPLSPLRKRTWHRGSSVVISPNGKADLPPVPPLSLETGETFETTQKHSTYYRPTKRRKIESAHPDIVARATVDTTIAIIPAIAFRRLTRVYPRASAHIVHVILTRLQRVTLRTGHAYLGLTSEVLRTEKLMNKYTTYDLPGFLRGSALERLKEKFSMVNITILFGPNVKTANELAAGTRKNRSRRERQRNCSSQPTNA